MPSQTNQRKRGLVIQLPIAVGKIKRQSPSTTHIPIGSSSYDNFKAGRRWNQQCKLNSNGLIK
ncbi:MAG: hypothetical protein KJ600_05075 [Nanoarchaeota archaeon]|nr:hypothetical protein [Nanoarchaeota archaeon]MBU1103903.1 hypothetical protein [Nanoarchaeota archaeon]